MNDIEILEDFIEGKIEPDKLENYKGGYKMGFFYTKDLQKAIKNLIQRNKLLEKQILEDSSYAILTKIEAKLKYDINKINEKLSGDEYINDYRTARLKGIKTKCKEILNIIGE